MRTLVSHLPCEIRRASQCGISCASISCGKVAERPNRFIFNSARNLVWNFVRDFARNLVWNFDRKAESLRFFWRMPKFLRIHICHLSQPALSTPYCHFAPAWNRQVPRPMHLKITSSGSLHPVLTNLRFSGAEDVELVDSIHAQNAPPHPAEMRDESAKSHRCHKARKCVMNRLSQRESLQIPLHLRSNLYLGC